ncbi:hypothetical protein MicloDRAFT_00067110 [Microvirga lotononidis]|uniref:Uncharacterized protein n=1 Tax=Microvirga lotononidis TaxID=864069 RepID=I4YPT9_9HYPH|nr:hypothetical protein MicloDRAFT_00067110 [Microvirga lotononidis]
MRFGSLPRPGWPTWIALAVIIAIGLAGLILLKLLLP